MTVKLDFREFESFGRESPQMAHAAQHRKMGHCSQTNYHAAQRTYERSRAFVQQAGQEGFGWIARDPDPVMAAPR